MSRSREVLRSYRLLQRTCRAVFQGDSEAVQAAKTRVREEFQKNRDITDEGQISTLLSQVRETEKFLRHNVVQATYIGNDTYRVRMTKDTALEDSPPLPKRNRSTHSNMTKR